MSHNPALRELGFSATDRVVVVHADDVGMCAATVDAFLELSAHGLTSSGSVMVPCRGFPDVAARAGRRTDLDVGVHLTLTSEWDRYRWGPVSALGPASGLLDDEGCFHRNQDQWTHVDPDAVRTEMAAQVDRALAAGLDLTHLDCHMFSMLHRELAAHYVALGFERQLPVLMTRQPQWVEALSERAIAEWEERGLPVFDHLREMPLDEPASASLDVTKRLLGELPPGLTYLITHPAADTPELRDVAADWEQRVADYETFRDQTLVDHVRTIGLQVVGWRPLRELLRDRCVRA
jgi:chitin disaccharide deacetylase